MQKKHIMLLCCLIAFSLALRIGLFVRLAPGDFYASPWYAGDGGDAAEYSAIAVNMNEGKGFSLHGSPTAVRAPLYPIFLAGVYGIFGNENLAAVRLVQIIIALFSIFLFWQLALRMTGHHGAALIASALLASHPRFIVYNLVILTETIFFTLLLLTLFMAVRFFQTQWRPFIFGSFAALALATLTRPTALTFMPLLALWVIWVQKKETGGLPGPFFRHMLNVGKRTLVPAMGIFLIIIGAWTARNYHHFKKVIAIANVTGVAESWDRTILEPLGISSRDILSKYQGLSESEFSSMGYRLFLSEMADDPKEIARITFLKFIYWFNPFLKHPSAAFRMLHAAATSALFILGGIGIWRHWRRVGPAVPALFLLLFLNFTAVHTLTIPYHRYRFPVIDVFLVLFAGFTLLSFWQWARGSIKPATP